MDRFGASSRNGQPLRIRVVSYNIRSGLQRRSEHRPTEGLEAIARVLRTLQGQAAQPEQFIAFVQEIEIGAPRSGLLDQPAWLRGHLGWKTGLFFQAFEQALIHEGRPTTWRYGNGLFAPHSIVGEPLERHVRQQQLEGRDYTQAHPEWPAWFGEPRVAGHVEAVLGGGELQLCCSHLGVTPDQREQQRESIADHLVKRMRDDHPVIVSADFNPGIDQHHFVDDPPSMKPCATPAEELGSFCARTGLTDVLTSLGVQAWTYPTPRPTFALDRVLVSRHFRLEDAGVFVDHAAEAASDHYAVFADLVVD